jgi:hypothetical protein
MPIAIETVAVPYFHCASPSVRARSEPMVVPQLGSAIPFVVISDPVRSLAPTVPKTEGVVPAAAVAPVDAAVRQMVRMAKWDADWDGNGADKPIHSSLRDARAFLRALAPESVVPKPALHADGHAILFLRINDIYAELEFLEGRRIGFYARRGGKEWSDEFSFDGSTLPQGLLQVGFVV